MSTLRFCFSSIYKKNEHNGKWKGDKEFGVNITAIKFILTWHLFLNFSPGHQDSAVIDNHYCARTDLPVIFSTSFSFSEDHPASSGAAYFNQVFPGNIPGPVSLKRFSWYPKLKESDNANSKAKIKVFLFYDYLITKK
ncbi:MAG: hypothetical protein PVH61_36175 [Candidatus Aminicenantes bacterium]